MYIEMFDSEESSGRVDRVQGLEKWKRHAEGAGFWIFELQEAEK